MKTFLTAIIAIFAFSSIAQAQLIGCRILEEELPIYEASMDNKDLVITFHFDPSFDDVLKSLGNSATVDKKDLDAIKKAMNDPALGLSKFEVESTIRIAPGSAYTYEYAAGNIKVHVPGLAADFASKVEAAVRQSIKDEGQPIECADF